MLGLGWVPSTLSSVSLPSISFQALPAQAEDGSRSDMVGFELLGKEGADAAGWSLYNARHSIRPVHWGCGNPDTAEEGKSHT